MSLFAEILYKQLPTVTTFPSINKKYINELKLSLDYNTTYHINIKLLYQIYFLPYTEHFLLPKKYTNKFQILEDIILNNPHIIDSERLDFVYKFMTTQRAYNSFRRLANYFRFKHQKHFEMDTDLCFVKFSDLSPKILITLLDKNTVYIFRISDLINIINKALTYAPHFFAEPYEIKNPYTNLPFTINNLYNIYFRLLNSSFIMPILYQLFFLSNFDLIRFKDKNECFIREKTIENFMSYASIDEKHYQINNMFYTHYKSVSFMIHSHFPREKLVSVFNKYLKSFLLEEYSLNPVIREHNKFTLESSLSLFSKLNPAFGQRILIKKRRASTTLVSPIIQYMYNDTVNEDHTLNHNTLNHNINSNIILPSIFQHIFNTFQQEEGSSEQSYLLNNYNFENIIMQAQLPSFQNQQEEVEQDDVEQDDVEQEEVEQDDVEDDVEQDNVEDEEYEEAEQDDAYEEADEYEEVN